MNELCTLPQQIYDAYQSCTDQERIYLKQILQELSEYGESPTYNDIWLADYSEIPVSIDTFIEDPHYLGNATRNGTAVYPAWRKVLRDIFNNGNKYNEIVLTGATRIGKTSTGITGTAYMLYRLMCLRDPQEFFHKKDVSKFSILFFNVTKDLAKGVAFREFNDTLKTSPWFCNHGRFSDSEQNFYYIPDGGKIIIDYGSEGTHALGQQIFVGFMDEINFARSGIKDINKAKSRMKDTYNTISARIKGTFRQNGQVYGKLFAISSKKSDSDFMEDYVADQMRSGAGDNMYLFDKPQWEVLPSSMFHKERFYIAVGNRHQKGFVVPANQSDPASIEDIKSQGFRILDPPIDMRPEFIADFDIALRDLAGISVPGALSYITQEIITSCIGTRRNPFFTDILEIGTRDQLTIEQFFHMEVFDTRLKSCPWYIDFDLSLNTDRSGISGICISGRKDIQTTDGNITSLPSFSHGFSIALQAPRGDKIPYQKILAFTLWLRRQGFNIARTSRDQFQSEYLGELLEAQNIISDKLSVDRSPDGYETVKSVMLEGRIDMLDVELLQQELIHLQRDPFTNICDHPVGGSKDVSDSFARAIWNAVKNNSGVPIAPSKVASAISAINGSKLYPSGNGKNVQNIPAMFPGVTRYALGKNKK